MDCLTLLESPFKMVTALPKIIFIAFLTLLLCTCNDGGTDPLVVPERIILTLVDVVVTEAYLHIVVTGLAGNETLVLQRDGNTVLSFPAVADTTIADTALIQATTYQYAATLQAGGITGKSNTTFAQTLAPTSHNFTWQTFLLGDGNGSAFYDIVLINDTLAYAVGEIYLSGDPTAYNLAKWDGNTWELIRIEFYTICGQSSKTPYPASSIFAFSANDVWISSRGGQLARWDGTTQTTTICNPDPFPINRIRGNAANSVYAVGAIGKIAYFNGSTWTSIESGTTTSILDAWGVVNPVTGKDEVYCAVSSFFEPGDQKILRIRNGTEVDSIEWNIGRNIFSVWTNRGFPHYTAGSRVFENSNGQWNESPLPAIATNKVRGQSLADIFVAGDLGLAAHFNGLEWHVFTDVYNAGYASVATRGNLVVLVGQRNGRGVTVIGRR